MSKLSHTLVVADVNRAEPMKQHNTQRANAMACDDGTGSCNDTESCNGTHCTNEEGA